MNTQRIDGHDFDPSTPMEVCTWAPETRDEDERRVHRNIARLRFRCAVETENVVQGVQDALGTHPADERWPSPFADQKETKV